MLHSSPARWFWLASLPLVVGCPKKPTGPVAPLEGWHKVSETATFACYHPPQFSALDEVQRKLKRAEALDAMLTQWKGEREDGIKFKDGVVDEVETTLFGVMNKVETVAIKKVFQDKRYKNRELTILKMLHHPNCVEMRQSFYTNGDKPDEVYLNVVMDYIPDTAYRVMKQYLKMK